MGVKTAALTIVVSIVGLAVGVGLYDYRAGIILFFGLAGAVGVWHLTTQE